MYMKELGSSIYRDYDGELYNIHMKYKFHKSVRKAGRKLEQTYRYNKSIKAGIAYAIDTIYCLLHLVLE